MRFSLKDLFFVTTLLAIGMACWPTALYMVENYRSWVSPILSIGFCGLMMLIGAVIGAGRATHFRGKVAGAAVGVSLAMMVGFLLICFFLV